MQFAILLCLCGFLYFYHLADRDLWSSHEARAGQDAQIILDEGVGRLPRLFDGHLELQKPPLDYWLVALVAWLRGAPVDAWAVRLPAALAAVLMVVALYWFGRSRGRPWLGLVAAAVLATAQHFTWLARVGRIDMPLTLTVATALLCYFSAWQARSMFQLLITYLALAAAVLLKGPIGLILPGLVIATHLLVEGELPRPLHGRRWIALAHRLGLWWGLPLVASLTLPCYLWAELQSGGAFFRTFFWYHNVERGLGGGALREWPWWYYGPQFLWDFLPWSPMVLAACWWLRRHWRQDAEARFGLVWLLSMTAFLSAMRFKRADYLLPAYPGAALLLGSAATWVRWPRPRLVGAIALTSVGALALGWWYYVDCVLPSHEPQREQRRFAEAIRKLAPRPQPVLLFRVEAHALAFHLGRRVNTFLEWENLDVWAGRPGFYIVMPPECVAEWPRYVTAGQLEEVMRNTDLAGGYHEEPLVLVRTRPNVPLMDATHARTRGTAPDRFGTDQRPAAAAGRRHSAGQGAEQLGDIPERARPPLRNTPSR